MTPISLAAAEQAWLATGAFLAGLVVGVLGTALWLQHRYRVRPLLLINPGHADMPMTEAMRHVRRHGGEAIRTGEDAARVLLDEAGRGLLSLWRPASPHLFRRLTPRQVRRARVVLGLRRADEIPDARFVRDEVERRWPTDVPLTLAHAPAVQKSDVPLSYVRMLP